MLYRDVYCYIRMMIHFVLIYEVVWSLTSCFLVFSLNFIQKKFLLSAERPRYEFSDF